MSAEQGHSVPKWLVWQVMRGLYRGVWRGLDQDPVDECVLGASGALEGPVKAPSLETFAHTTMAGFALAYGPTSAAVSAAVAASKPRVLIAGLGAGSLVRFLSRVRGLRAAAATVVARKSPRPSQIETFATPVCIMEPEAAVVELVRKHWPATRFSLLEPGAPDATFDVVLVDACAHAGTATALRTHIAPCAFCVRAAARSRAHSA